MTKRRVLTEIEKQLRDQVTQRSENFATTWSARNASHEPLDDDNDPLLDALVKHHYVPPQYED